MKTKKLTKGWHLLRCTSLTNSVWSVTLYIQHLYMKLLLVFFLSLCRSQWQSSNNNTCVSLFSRNNGYAISTPTQDQYRGDGIGWWNIIRLDYLLERLQERCKQARHKLLQKSIKEEVVLPLPADLQRSVWIMRQSERTCHLLPFNLCMPSARTNAYEFIYFLPHTAN